ncbi:MAG: hypothetical protein FD144_4230 [Rhodospirillaceae bacterium]|nr:MAG: hypothetical protein FD144_4230 [Rhodospirillaceae bacterium]
MQVTKLAPLTDAQNNVIEPAGIQILYFEDGYQWCETRRPVGDGNVKRTIRNVTTGAEEVAVVAADTLPAV